MRRHAALLLALALPAALLVRSQPAGAAAPSGCTFPTSVDNLQAVKPGDTLVSTMLNQFLCAVNALEQHTLDMPQPETVCNPVTIPAGGRQLITFTVPAPALTGTEPVFLSVQDPLSPARLTPESVQDIGGSAVTAWVFNRDAGAQRSGTACIQVVR